MARVEITHHLFAYFPQLRGRDIDVAATTAAEVVQAVEALAPGFAFYVCDERGSLRAHVNLFIGEELMKDRVTLSDRVEPNSRVYILQALSGG